MVVHSPIFTIQVGFLLLFFFFLSYLFHFALFLFPFSLRTMVVTAHYSVNLFFFLFSIAFSGQKISWCMLWETSWRFISNEISHCFSLSLRVILYLFCWGRSASLTSAGLFTQGPHKNKGRKDETMWTGITSETARFFFLYPHRSDWFPRSPFTCLPIPRQFNNFVNKAVFVLLIWFFRLTRTSLKDFR